MWTGTDSSQLKTMSMIRTPDFVIQDELYVTEGVPDVQRISSQFSILSEIETVEQMRGVFWGANPNLLLVAPMDKLDDVIEHMQKLVRLLTTVGQLDVVLFSQSSAVDAASFLQSAMLLKDRMPFLPERVGQADRLIGSISRSQTYDVWVVRTSHQSRSESASVVYKMINMRLPGESADGVLFSEPDIEYPVIVVQYALGWEAALIEFLGVDKSSLDIVPGSDAQASKFVFLEIGFAKATELVEQFGRYPRFALLPLRWYTGAAVNALPRRLEVSMSSTFREGHLKFFYGYLLAGLWELGNVFQGVDVAIQIMHSKRMRLGLSQRAYEYVCEHKEEWLSDMGLELKDEQTGQSLSGYQSSTTQASTVPEAWGPCESVFLTNVPPYWREEVLKQVLLTNGTKQKDFVLDKCRFHLGDIRTKTWMLTGPAAGSLVGKVLQAASGQTMIVPISAREYHSKKAQVQGKGRGKGRGKGAGGRGAESATAAAMEVDISTNDAKALKFMKRKRGDEALL